MGLNVRNVICKTSAYLVFFYILNIVYQQKSEDVLNVALFIIMCKLLQELRAYMLKYGGRYENYFSRYRVTHIICSNLPDSKLKNLRFVCFSSSKLIRKEFCPKYNLFDSVIGNSITGLSVEGYLLLNPPGF